MDNGHQLYDVSRIRDSRQMRRGRRNRFRPNSSNNALKQILMSYIVAVFALAGCILVQNLGILAVGYVVIGVYLTRYVSRRIIWNQHLASLADIYRAKVTTWYSWPISIPVLIWQMYVVQRL